METEVISKSEGGFITWAIGVLGTAMGILYAWLTRNTLRANKLSELMAVNIEGDKNRDKAINEIKQEVNEMSKKVDQVVLCVADQKAMYNEIHNLVIKQSKLIDGLLD